MLLSALQNLRLSEDDLESEVVFWIEGWSMGLGRHRFGAALVHDQSALPVSLRRYCATLLGPSTIPCQLVALLVDRFDVSLDSRKNVLAVQSETTTSLCDAASTSGRS